MSNNKFKVLIVEDEANICSFIETLLTTNDYQALVAQIKAESRLGEGTTIRFWLETEEIEMEDAEDEQ